MSFSSIPKNLLNLPCIWEYFMILLHCKLINDSLINIFLTHWIYFPMYKIQLICLSMSEQVQNLPLLKIITLHKTRWSLDCTSFSLFLMLVLLFFYGLRFISNFFNPCFWLEWFEKNLIWASLLKFIFYFFFALNSLFHDLILSFFLNLSI